MMRQVTTPFNFALTVHFTPAPMHPCTLARRSGFSLVLVLGVMVLLAILVTGLAITVRSEIQVSSGFADRTRAKYLANAGLQRSLHELSQDNIGIDSYEETWAEIRSEDDELDFGDGRFIVRGVDESGKLNINTADRQTLVAFFTQVTNDSALAEELADCVIDWRDTDDTPEPLGAESDYYLSLPHPYHAKNAPFDSPYELLLVKGMTKEIFYGDPELVRPPLPELVTTFSASPNLDERGLPRININMATREQLMEALGDVLTEAEIDAILRYRDGTQQRPTQPPTQPQPPSVRPQPPSVQPPQVRPQPPSGQPPQVRPQPPSGQPPQVRPQPPSGQPPQVRPQPPSGQPPQVRPQPSGQQPSIRPQLGGQQPQVRPSTGQQPPSVRPQPDPGGQPMPAPRPSRGVPAEAVAPSQRPSSPLTERPSPELQRPTGPQSGQQRPSQQQRPIQQQPTQQRRQIRSPLDLQRVLPKEKLIAIWERITMTDEPMQYGLINLNTAPAQVLAALLPENTAAVDEILSYREQNGSFVSVGELLNIASLAQSEVQQLANKVCTKSSVFRLRGLGIVGEQRTVHLIECILERQPTNAGMQNPKVQSEISGSEPTTPSVQFVIRYWRER